MLVFGVFSLPPLRDRDRGRSLSRGAVVHVGLRAVQFAAGAVFFKTAEKMRFLDIFCTWNLKHP